MQRLHRMFAAIGGTKLNEYLISIPAAGTGDEYWPIHLEQLVEQG